MSDELAMILAYECEDLTHSGGLAFREAYEEACRRDRQAAYSLWSDFQE